MKASLAEEWTAGWKIVPPGGGPAHVFVAPAIDQREWGELIRQQIQKHGGHVPAGDGTAVRGGIKLNGLRWEVSCSVSTDVCTVPLHTSTTLAIACACKK